MKYDFKPTSFLGKCGNDCGSCPLHKNNLLTMEDRIQTAEGCGKYINWNPTPEKLKACSGCQSSKGFLYIPKCKNRMCAYNNNIKNCAYCSEFPCEDSPKLDVEKIEKRLGGPIPQEEYNLYVGPWTSTAILQEVRSKLKPSDIADVTPMNANLRIVEFPSKLELKGEEKKAYQSLHKLISSIEPLENLSYARLESLKETRKYYLRLLWAFGLYGDYISENGNKYLLLKSEAYFSEMKKTRYFSYNEIVQKRFLHMAEFGVQLDIIPDKSLEDILTPMKGIRKQGWSLRMSFKEKLHNEIGLKALTNFVQKLFNKSGTRGYTYFARADMRIIE